MPRSARPVEKRFLQQLEAWSHPEDQSRWNDATPGFRLQAWQAGRLKVDVACGETSLVYDWASLTKVVFSVSSAMIEVERDSLGLSDSLVHWLPELILGDRRSRDGRGVLDDLRVRDLLCHSAGMTWWKPFYKTIAKSKPRDHEAAWSILTDLVFRDVRKRAANGEIAKAKKGPAVYSDLDFFLLGEILRRSSFLSLADQYGRVQDRLGLQSTSFHALSRRDLARSGQHTLGIPVRSFEIEKSMVAPTEYDRAWRGRQLQGEVHDENASSLKGIAPHAGLFGPIDDLSLYGLELRKLVRQEKSKLPAAGAGFLKRAVSKSRGDWAFGFMMPTRGKASCGPQFSLSSLGHTGFTGTSLWYDPKQDLLVTILSNRVCPTRKNTRFLKLRPALHTFVVDAINKP